MRGVCWSGLLAVGLAAALAVPAGVAAEKPLDGAALKRAGGPLPDRTSQIWSNAYMAIAVEDESGGDHAYRFTLGAVQGNPSTPLDDNQRVLSGHPYPWSAATTIQVDGTNYVYGQEGVPLEPLQEDPVYGGFTARMSFGPDIVIRQRLIPVEGITHHVDNVGFVVYEIRNEGLASHDVGVRIMLDAMLGDNDGVPLMAGGTIYTTEHQWVAPAIPDVWYALNAHPVWTWRSVGRVNDLGSEPDRLVFASWAKLWDYLTGGDPWSYPMENLALGDSAALLYWDPRALPPGWTWTVATTYGVDEPAELVPGYLIIQFTGTERVHSGGTFEISATITNTSPFDAIEAEACVVLPPEISLRPAEDACKLLGALPSGSTVAVSWDAQAAIEYVGFPEYCVQVQPFTLDIPPNMACRQIEVYPPVVPAVGPAGVLLAALGAGLALRRSARRGRADRLQTSRRGSR